MKEKEEKIDQEMRGFYGDKAMEERIQAFLTAEKTSRPQKVLNEASLAE